MLRTDYLSDETKKTPPEGVAGLHMRKLENKLTKTIAAKQ